VEGKLAKTAALLGFAAVAALIGGSAGYVYFGGKDDPLSACRGGVSAGSVGGPFSLVNSEGNLVTDTEVITKPSLIYFGYTYCPDICPFDNARNAQAVDILEERGIEATPVFITVDPLRDTPEVMGEYAANMHPAMIGLSGTEDQVKSAADVYRVAYQRREIENGDYLMDHTVLTYLVLPETGFADFFQRSATPEDIAEAVACFVGA
jgi:protein SCO1